jgi:ketosteroid isomerase-like protein
MQVAIPNPSMHMSRRMALVPILIAVLAQATFANPQHPGMPRAQKHDARHEIDQFEGVWRNAVLTSNVTVLNTLLADDYMAITAQGTLQTKEQTLARIASGRVHYTALELSDRKVRFYGTTALVTSLAQVTGSDADGEEISGSFRYTQVYVRNAQSKWKIVSFEASRIHEAGEHR